MACSDFMILANMFDAVWSFFAPGGFFMILLGGCSLIAVGAIVFKLLTLRTAGVIPHKLGERVALGEIGESELATSNSVLARLCLRSNELEKREMTAQERRSTIEALAREEVVTLQSGLPVLEIVVTIAPLLGILGTASGLELVFSNFADANSQEAVADGIGRALGTTIVGLAIAVPSVIALVSFGRKIERLSARLEVLLEAHLSHRSAITSGEAEKL
jgi:biopolymer transport protein ExbB